MLVTPAAQRQPRTSWTRWHIVVCFTLALSCSGVARATPPENWEVMRVFIQDDPEHISRLVTSHYATVLIDDLSRKLVEQNNRRKVSLLRNAALEEAVYLARLEGQTIVSDQSRWKLSGPSPSPNVELGGVSLAMRTARGIPPTDLQLSDHAQFSPMGLLELPMATEVSTYWFGFSVNSREQENGRVFDFQIPPAIGAKLLVSVPTNIELSSNTVATERLASLTEQLPDSWPATAIPSSSNAAQWWLINVSGVSSFQLLARQQTGANLSAYKHLVRSAVIDYIGRHEQLESRARFRIVGSDPAHPMRLQLSSQFKVETVLMDGLPVRWSVAPSETADAYLIELTELKSSSQEMNIELRALCPMPASDSIMLPQIAIADAYALDGKCRLWGSEGWVADSLQAVGIQAQRVLRTATGEEPSVNVAEGDELIWQIGWMGNAPQLEASFSRQRKPAVARSLTRFSIQADWLAANCRLRVDAPQLTSNEMRFPVGNGWFIDSVRLIGAEPDIRPRVEDRVGATSPMIVIDWEGNRQQLSIELEVRAHSPRDVNSDSISLRSPRLVSLPQADQIDNYVIEPSSRFAVRIDAKLLPYQRLRFDLPVWQQELLPSTTDMWLFQGVRGSIPPITLIAASGNYSSQQLTLVTPQPAQASPTPSAIDQQQAGNLANGNVVVTTHIQCQPTSGSIDRVALTLPAGQVASSWQWTLGQPGESEELTLLQSSTEGSDAELEASQEQRAVRVDLELPSPLSTPFTLTGQAVLKTDAGEADLTIPVVGVLATTHSESTLLISRDMASGLENVTVELIPDAQNALREALSIRNLQLGSSPANGWVAARLEAGTSQLLTLKLPTPGNSVGWIWSEVLRHTLWDNGYVSHDVRWVVAGTSLAPLKIQLPDGWQVEEITVDEVAIDHPGDGQQVQLELPGLDRTTVSMRCTSKQKPPTWLSHDHWERPRLSLPILAAHSTLVIPPSRFAVRQLPTQWSADSTPLRLMDRLHPMALWSRLAPTLSLKSNPTAASPNDWPNPPAGWSMLELSSGGIPPQATDSAGDGDEMDAEQNRIMAPGEWIVSRSALSALALAFVLLIASLIWFCLGTAPRLWWLVITLSLILVILVPNWLLAPAQLFLLAVGLATLLRLCAVVYNSRKTPLQTRSRSSIVHSAASVSTTLVVFLCCWCGSALGQSSSPSSSQFSGNDSATKLESNSTGQPSASRPEIFSVLIPIDEEGAVAGAYAYAPTRLLEILAAGDASTTRSTQPKILSADYTLRMRRGLAGGPDQIQEMSVEFRVQVAQTDLELRLPFNINQLQLQRGSVAGQELFVGGRWLYQLPDAVIFRPNVTGTLRLQLQFEPRDLTVTPTQANLRCSIPPIPTANLRIVADSSSTFEIRSSGTGRKTISSVSTELLGPISELNVQWSPTTQRVAVGQITGEVYADTWLHARGSQVSAICQIRIDNPRTLPRDLHVVSEPGWEPVGTFWEDGELTANEQSALGGRQVYTLRCREDWNQTSPLILRVPMVPRDEANIGNLAVPFFTLREASQQAVTRTLAWSAEEHAAWRPDGLDLWQELTSVPGLEWGELAWDQRPQLYRVVGTLATALRSAVTTPQPTVDEMTQVHLGQGEIRLNYRGQFSSLQSRPLALLIPAGSRIEQVLLDGNAVPYRLSERGDSGLVELLSGEKPSGARVVELSSSQTLALGRATHFPRVSMLEYAANRSLYRVQCGAGLECEVLADDELTLAPTMMPPHELLPALETLVGQVDLRDAYRDIPRLPLRFVVQRRPEPQLLGAMMALQPGESGWRVTVSAIWEAENSLLDFAFFELPLAVRDSVDTGQLPAQLKPLGDSGRMTLRMLPPAPVAGKTRVEFTFTLSAASTNQSLSIPAVSVVTSNPIQPLLGLPLQIDGQAVRWTPPGRRVEELPSELHDPRWGSHHQWYELESPRTQVSWKRYEAEAKRTERILTHFTLLSQQNDRLAGHADFWLVPHGELDLRLSVPKQCQVLGVEVGDQPAIWTQAHDELSVLLLPNYLPLKVRVLLHWQIPVGDTWTLDLPRVLNAEDSPQLLEFVENRLPQFATKLTAQHAVQAAILPELTRRWARLLVDTLQSGRTRPAEELVAWLEVWQPQLVGLDGNAPIDSQELAEAALLLDEDDSQEWAGTTADELWEQMWLLAHLSNSSDSNEDISDETSAVVEFPPIAPATSIKTIPSRYARLSSAQDTVVLTRIANGSIWTAQWLAAGFLATASLLILLLARRIARGYARLVAAQPWLYWLQLSLLAWCLLPVMWPSWVLLVTSAGMLISQSLDTRRRHRLLARV